MLRSVYYGPHTITPWCSGTGYLNPETKNVKSNRSREPVSIWQSLNSKSDNLGSYDLHICQHCFLYSSKAEDIQKHQKFCRYPSRHPGSLVFEDEDFMYYEVMVQEIPQNPVVDPQAETVPADPVRDSLKLYLQCLSLMGHLFLDTKSICFNIEGFVFYTAVEKTTGFVAGFFSKEKHSWHDYNLACIVIFPPWQKRGLGRRLIKLSYWLIQPPQLSGSPEKPLSSHGRVAYEAYWAHEVLKTLCARHKTNNRKGKLLDTITRLSTETKIDPRDLRELLVSAGVLENGVLKVSRLVNRKKRTPVKKARELLKSSQ